MVRLRPMEPADRNFLRDFFRTVSDRPLDPTDARYVPIYDSTDGDDPVQLLARAIEWTPGESVQLLSGSRGTGKSTELRRLREHLRRSGYVVVLCDIEDYLNLSTRVEVSDFLLAMVSAFSDALVKEGLLKAHPMKESYWARFSAFIPRTTAEYSEISAGAKIGLELDQTKPGDPFAVFKANLKADPTFRQKLQEKSAGHLRALINDVRNYVAECVQQIKKEHGDLTEVVLLLDSMEHIRGTSVTANEVQSSVEALFAAQSDKLHIPFLHVVYTVPQYLKIRYPNLSALYEPGGVQVVPAIKVQVKKDGSECPAGIEALKRVIAVRGDWMRLLGTPERLHSIIMSSGGHLRDLLRILAEIIRRADRLPVSDHSIESAVNQIKNGMLPIADDDAVWLARIASTNRASLAVASQLPDLARFLDTHCVLCYRNGDEWYDVHPLIRDEVMAQSLELARRTTTQIAARPESANQQRTRGKIIPKDLSISLRSMHMEHIRLFDDVTLDFTRNGVPRQFTLILAENGHGKSTVLQAIALAASGIAGANLLAGNAASFFDRRFLSGSEEAGRERGLCQIEATFDLPQDLTSLPSDLHAERAVLAAALLDGEVPGRIIPRVAGILQTGDFYDPRHALLWEVFLALHGRGEPLDVLTVAAELRAREWLHTAGGVQYLGELTDAIPAVSNSEEYARVIADLAGRRRALGAYPAATPGLPDVGPLPGVPSSLRSRLFAPPNWKQFAGSSVRQSADKTEESNPLEGVRAEDLPLWFVAGYGTGRMLPRSRSSKEPGRRSVDRLQSLFSPEPLVATGFADILADLLGQEVARAYADTLRSVLVGSATTPGLFPTQTSIRFEGLELRGKNASRGSNDLVEADRFVIRIGEHLVPLPAPWLSAGYQATVAWVADLLGQVTLEAGRVLPPAEISGLVLIDEIDLHLHPQWQVSLVPALRQIFPRLQFVVTTHSPMVLPGFRQDEIIMLSLDEAGNIQARGAPVAPALKTGSEILEWFFGIENLHPAELGQALRDYTYLASDPYRTDEEDMRMHALRARLKEADADPGWEPEPRMKPEADA